ncbi:MAG: T9SS type A sorting domain-containing protein [Candidatus Eisenbacteria bacterium]|uniref:T9SS type A sorting domain-containing protein n=1 Tax=Eiseniibacteriota bacterium TaxID=2212470 RepID=A0A538TP17_UNCEI|nr:MAG: T9SS type A sorting domain-containing protein [Candidatus Eisenbacteria bacterium]
MRCRIVLAWMLCLVAAPAWAASFRPGALLVATDDSEPLRLGLNGRITARTPLVQAILDRHGLRRYVVIGASPRSPDRRRFLTLESDRNDFDPLAAARELSATRAFRAVVPDLLLRLYATVPNDPYVQPLYQWYVESPAGVGLPGGWDLGRGDTNTVIAIMDNGIDIGHPDLASQIWINRAEVPGNGVDDDGNGLVDDVKGWDFGNGDADPSAEAMIDPSGIDEGFHGTFVAGIAAAATDNGAGIAGAGWQCRIMALKVGNSAGELPLSAVTAAFEYAAGEGADVLNMSFGTRDPTAQDYFQALVDMATAANVLCVAAAGNDSLDTPSYPAACANVLAVAATGEDNRRAAYSNWGSWVDVAAPGSAMWSSICRNYELDFVSQIIYLLYFGWDGENPYMYGDGTSFASPLVAGVCGLTRARMPGLTPQQIIAHVVATGDLVTYDHPIGPRVNAYRALSEPAVDVEPLAPPRTAFGSAWPNPFGRATTIDFALAAAAPVRLRVYDNAGRLVRTLIEATLPAGRHAAIWDGTSSDGRTLGSGIYFAALESGGRRAVRKIVITR